MRIQLSGKFKPNLNCRDFQPYTNMCFITKCVLLQTTQMAEPDPFISCCLLYSFRVFSSTSLEKKCSPTTHSHTFEK